VTQPEVPRLADRFAGYAHAQVVVDLPDGGRLRVRPAPRPGAFPWDATVHVLTAYDPGPARLGTAENRRRQGSLEAELAALGLAVIPAVASAGDGTHAEVSAVVVGWDDEAALELARRYGQDAIFRWTPDAWAVVPCDRGPAWRSGWVLDWTP
jgi:hypothetical protein